MSRKEVICNVLAMTVICVLFFCCEEAKRFEISGDDSTPPAAPTFLYATPLNGGAYVHYQRPTDEDVLSIEASYKNSDGKDMRFIASYFTDSVEVLGFGQAGQHVISLCAIDRAGNRSASKEATVTALEPPVSMVAQSVRVIPSFGSIIIKWEDLMRKNIYVFVDFSYTENGAKQSFTNVFASYMTESQSIDSLKLNDGQPIDIKVRIEDKYGNSTPAKDTTILLLTDEKLSKAGWTLPAAGVEIGGVIQSDGSNDDGDMPEVIDDLTEEDILKNFYLTNSNAPWNIIIDLGGEYELSRILTHQRHTWTSDMSLQGAYYRGDNVLAYNMYIWDGVNAEWEFASRHVIPTPLVKQESDYVVLGNAGDKAYLYPEEPKFSKPTRYFRFEALNGKYISEITLFGRKKQ